MTQTWSRLLTIAFSLVLMIHQGDSKKKSSSWTGNNTKINKASSRNTAHHRAHHEKTDILFATRDSNIQVHIN